MNILLTGANGFVGSKLAVTLENENYFVRKALRNIGNFTNESSYIEIGNIDSNTLWSEALENIDVVIHCAARAHKSDNNSKLAEDEFIETNLNGTVSLLNQLKGTQVKHFIFISSVKVFGETTLNHVAFKEDDIKNPNDFYGISKLKAEQKVVEKCNNLNISYTIIRPTLVYGDGAKGNLLSIKKILNKNLPFPTFSHSNKRRLTHINNLIDFILCVLKNNKSHNEVFNVADGIELSTGEIIKLIKSGSNSKSLLINIPSQFYRFLFMLINKHDFKDKLLSDLTVDISKSKKLLNWIPPFKPEPKDFM